MDMAVVGPEIRCRDEPKRAATMGVIIAVYKPYCGGRPAIVAKATPWGKTITAPVNPAMKSARRLVRFTKGSHVRNGKNIFRSMAFTTAYDIEYKDILQFRLYALWIDHRRGSVFQDRGRWSLGTGEVPVFPVQVEQHQHPGETTRDDNPAQVVMVSRQGGPFR